MTDQPPVRAGALEPAELSSAEFDAVSTALFSADDDARTVPVSIIAPRRLGDSELSVYPLGLGAARLAAVDDETAEAVLTRFVSRAGTLIDFASHGVAGGRAEELVGSWLRRNRVRDRTVISARLDVSLTPAKGAHPLGAMGIVRAVEASLNRLRTDRVELLTIDLSAPGVVLEDALSAAEFLVSNGDVEQLVATGAGANTLIAARVLASGGLPKFSAVLAPWDIIRRDVFEGDLRMIAAAQGMALLPDASFASALLSAPALAQKVFAARMLPAALKLPPIMRAERDEPKRAVELLGRGRQHRIGLALDKVADELGSRPASVAIAWLLAKRNVAAPIVGVSRADQLDPLMDAAALRLTRAQMLELDRASEQPR